jgi:hypothetical protein
MIAPELNKTRTDLKPYCFKVQYVWNSCGTGACQIARNVSLWPGTILVVCVEDSISQKMAAQTFIYLIWHTNIRARPTYG